MKWVRPAISGLMAGGVLWGFVVGRVSTEAFLGIAVGCIGWWYYDRSKDKRANGHLPTTVD